MRSQDNQYKTVLIMGDMLNYWMDKILLVVLVVWSLSILVMTIKANKIVKKYENYRDFTIYSPRGYVFIDWKSDNIPDGFRDDWSIGIRQYKLSVIVLSVILLCVGVLYFFAKL